MKSKGVIGQLTREEFQKEHSALIRRILNIIKKHCDENNTIQSYHDIGVDLSKLGLSDAISRTKEWNRVMEDLENKCEYCGKELGADNVSACCNNEHYQLYMETKQ